MHISNLVGKMRLRFILLTFVVIDVFIIASFLVFTQRRELHAGASTKHNANQKEQGHSTILPRPKILSRDAWEAKKPIKEMKEHTPVYITIHHTASPQKDIPIEKKLKNLQHF